MERERDERMERPEESDRKEKDEKREVKIKRKDYKRAGEGEGQRASTLCCTTWPTKRPPETFIKATASSETHTAAAAAAVVCVRV